MAWWFWASDRKTKAVIRKHITNPFPATVAPATEWGTQTEDTPPPQALPPLT